MPRLTPGDRKILIIAAAAFVLLVVLGFLISPNSTDNEIATTYSTASEGAKAAYLLLQELGYHVERWEKPDSDLKPDSHTVLVIADPITAPNGKQKAAIERFMTGGGRVITTGIVGGMFLPQNSSQLNLLPTGISIPCQGLTPSPLTRAAPKITMIPYAIWSGTSAIPLYGIKDAVVATRTVHGQGDAIWLAAATPFTNAGIQKSGNLEFLLAALGDKQQTRILFDEYVHDYGEREEMEKRHPLTIALLAQSAVLALALLLTFSRRSGPLRPVPPPPRLAPLEFVETLGGLYQQAHAASVAVDVYYQRFRYWTTRRLGLNANASPHEIARAVGDRWGMKDDAFLETLTAAAAARYQPDLPQKQALEVVQKLHAYAVQFKLFPKEKL